jgi:hypothetical protein
MTGDNGERRTRGPSGGGAYEGNLGRTRTEIVQVWMPDDSVRALPVYVGVDAVADPALATLARSGMLHHVGDHVELAVPFIYHDAKLPLFVLVVPEQLRHRALALRAEHMALLAAESTHPVPAYVREVEVVVGPAGLASAIGRGPSIRVSRAPSFNEREATGVLLDRMRELQRREQLVLAREQALLRTPSTRVALDDDTLYGEEEGPYDGDEIDDADDDELEEVEDIAEDEAVLNADEDVSIVDGRAAVPAAMVRAVVIEDTDVVDVSESPDAPAWFAGDATSDLCLITSNGRVWLLVRGLERFEGGELDLIVQLARDTVVPVVLVSLVFGTNGSAQVLRGAIDLDDAEQRGALDALAEHYEVEIMAWSGDDRFEHVATLNAPRERNVAAIRTYLEQNPTPDRSLWEVARSHALATPPFPDDSNHPFRDAGPREPPRTATEAAVLLDDVAQWLEPERRRQLLLGLGVPDELIDAGVREVVAFALDWGLAVPRHVAARALELGLEKDEPALVLRRIEGLCRASNAEELGGLEESVLRAMWSEALEQAARLGVSLSDTARDLAKQHAGERALVHATALSDPHDQALEPVRAKALRGAQPDLGAMLELAQRGAYRDLLAICRVTEQLDVDAAAQVFAHVSRRNDPVALDALLSLLSMSEPPRVRLGAALALASRHAVAAIDELCLHVAQESSPEWRLFALALGRYGAGSFRAITRALAREHADDERTAEVQAHLALHGARAQVRAKARLRDGKEASLAERALTRASQLREGKNSPPELEQQGPLTVFCQGFDRSLRDLPS